MRLRRLAGAVCVIAAALSPLAAPAIAAPRLDARFGDGGIARAPVRWEGFREFFGAMRPVRQADGKVLVAAQLSGDRDPEEFVLARFDRTGALDATFGRRGRLKINFPWQFVPVTVLTQRDGRILLVGVVGGYRYFAYRPMQIGVLRLLPDGSRDRSFGANGFVAWNPPWHAADVAMDISLGLALRQPDDRLLIAAAVDVRAVGPGVTFPAAERHSVVFVRFGPDGSVDRSFGRAGMAELDRNGYPQAWARLPDGRLVAVEAGNEWSLESFAPNPAPADGFVAAGSVHLGPNVLDVVSEVVPSRDGALLMIGAVDVSERSGPVAALRRVLPDGSLDPTFGRDCGETLRRLRASFTRGGAPTADGGVLVTATKLLIHARPRRVDGFVMTHDATGCLAGTPLRLRDLVVGPPLLGPGRSALLGATFNDHQGVAGGLALVKIRR
jgi:uncharacterized delta-60 repeat protein